MTLLIQSKIITGIEMYKVWNKQTWSHIYFQVKEERKMNKILSVHGNKIFWMHIE